MKTINTTRMLSNSECTFYKNGSLKTEESGSRYIEYFPNGKVKESWSGFACWKYYRNGNLKYNTNTCDFERFYNEEGELTHEILKHTAVKTTPEENWFDAAGNVVRCKEVNPFTGHFQNTFYTYSEEGKLLSERCGKWVKHYDSEGKFTVKEA